MFLVPDRGSFNSLQYAPLQTGDRIPAEDFERKPQEYSAGPVKKDGNPDIMHDAIKTRSLLLLAMEEAHCQSCHPIALMQAVPLNSPRILPSPNFLLVPIVKEKKNALFVSTFLPDSLNIPSFPPVKNAS